MLELVKISNNNPITNTLTVAQVFEKRHSDILRAIKMLKCSKDFNQRNFALVKYTDEKGEKRNSYDMTRDGWTFLVMGFSGTKAAVWKEKYIEAFNKMEQALQNQLPTQTQIPTLKTIGGLVKKCCAVVVRDELNKILNPEKVEHWEVNDNDLILQLYRWHATLNKSETLEFRRLHAENDLLRQKLEEVKKLLG